MVRNVFSKVMWVGRATVFFVGLAVILALVFGVASTALGADGNFFKLGNRNVAQTVSTLVKQGTGAALALQVGANQPPMTVNPAAGTATGLSAAELEGRTWAELEPRGYAQVTTSPSIEPGNSKGVIGVVRTDAPGNYYCFNLSFTPRAAVASAHLNNNATVGTDIGTSVPSACEAPYRDAAARTYAANVSDPNAMVRTDVNFGIVFM